MKTTNLRSELRLGKEKQEIIGTSVEGSPIVLVTFGVGKRKILVVGGVHGELEKQSVDIANGLIQQLKTSTTELNYQLDIIPCLNPDGLLLIGQQVNANGIDLNRNYPSTNQHLADIEGKNKGGEALSEPETNCLYNLVHQNNYDLIITLHQKYELIDYDGPVEQKILEQLSQNLSLPIKKLGSYPGSMGAYFGEELKIPLITIEIPYTISNQQIQEKIQQIFDSLLGF